MEAWPGTGWPQAEQFTGVLRNAMDVDEDGGVAFGTAGGQVYVSDDVGDNWEQLPFSFPRILTARRDLMARVTVTLPRLLEPAVGPTRRVELEAGIGRARRSTCLLERHPTLRVHLFDEAGQPSPARPLLHRW